MKTTATKQLHAETAQPKANKQAGAQQILQRYKQQTAQLTKGAEGKNDKLDENWKGYGKYLNNNSRKFKRNLDDVDGKTVDVHATIDSDTINRKLKQYHINAYVDSPNLSERKLVGRQLDIEQGSIFNFLPFEINNNGISKENFDLRIKGCAKTIFDNMNELFQ